MAHGLLMLGIAGLVASSGTVAFADQPQAGLVGGGEAGAIVAQDQSAGTITVGPSGQQAGQTQGTQQSSQQEVDPTTSAITGGVGQANGQQSNTRQTIDQTESGTFVVFGGGLHQRANQTAGTVQSNDQSIDGGVVLGRVDQSNLQTADINQSIRQSLTGTFVVFGGTLPPDPALAAGFSVVGQCLVCSDKLSDSSLSLAAGDVRDSGGSGQRTNGTHVVLGNLDQSVSQSSSDNATNDQTVSGTIIIGDVSQANAQHATVGQSIDESLSGTYIVFGTLDQSADQVALINQSNHQKLKGG